MESQDEVTTPAVALVGMLTRPHATLLHQGKFHPFVTIFQVHGLTDFFGVPSSELTNCTYDADVVLGKPIKELEQRLGNFESFRQRVSVANHFFAERLKHVRAVDRMACLLIRPELRRQQNALDDRGSRAVFREFWCGITSSRNHLPFEHP